MIIPDRISKTPSQNAFATFLWIWILSRVPLSQAYPWVAIGIAIVPLLGWYVFNERIKAKGKIKRMMTQDIDSAIKWRSPANGEPDLLEHNLTGGKRCREDSQAKEVYEFLHRV